MRMTQEREFAKLIKISETSVGDLARKGWGHCAPKYNVPLEEEDDLPSSPEDMLSISWNSSPGTTRTEQRSAVKCPRYVVTKLNFDECVIRGKNVPQASVKRTIIKPITPSIPAFSSAQPVGDGGEVKGDRTQRNCDEEPVGSFCIPESPPHVEAHEQNTPQQESRETVNQSDPLPSKCIDLRFLDLLVQNQETPKPFKSSISSSSLSGCNSFEATSPHFEGLRALLTEDQAVESNIYSGQSGEILYSSPPRCLDLRNGVQKNLQESKSSYCGASPLLKAFAAKPSQSRHLCSGRSKKLNSEFCDPTESVHDDTWSSPIIGSGTIRKQKLEKVQDVQLQSCLVGSPCRSARTEPKETSSALCSSKPEDYLRNSAGISAAAGTTSTSFTPVHSSGPTGRKRLSSRDKLYDFSCLFEDTVVNTDSESIYAPDEAQEGNSKIKRAPTGPVVATPPKGVGGELNSSPVLSSKKRQSIVRSRKKIKLKRRLLTEDTHASKENERPIQAGEDNKKVNDNTHIKESAFQVEHSATVQESSLKVNVHDCFDIGSEKALETNDTSVAKVPVSQEICHPGSPSLDRKGKKMKQSLLVVASPSLSSGPALVGETFNGEPTSPVCTSILVCKSPEREENQCDSVSPVFNGRKKSNAQSKFSVCTPNEHTKKNIPIENSAEIDHHEKATSYFAHSAVSEKNHKPVAVGILDTSNVLMELQEFTPERKMAAIQSPGSSNESPVLTGSKKKPKRKLKLGTDVPPSKFFSPAHSSDSCFNEDSPSFSLLNLKRDVVHEENDDHYVVDGIIGICSIAQVTRELQEETEQIKDDCAVENITVEENLIGESHKAHIKPSSKNLNDNSAVDTPKIHEEMNNIIELRNQSFLRLAEDSGEKEIMVVGDTSSTKIHEPPQVLDEVKLKRESFLSLEKYTVGDDVKVPSNKSEVSQKGVSSDSSALGDIIECTQVNVKSDCGRKFDSVIVHNTKNTVKLSVRQEPERRQLGSVVSTSVLGDIVACSEEQEKVFLGPNGEMAFHKECAEGIGNNGVVKEGFDKREKKSSGDSSVIEDIFDSSQACEPPHPKAETCVTEKQTEQEADLEKLEYYLQKACDSSHQEDVMNTSKYIDSGTSDEESPSRSGMKKVVTKKLLCKPINQSKTSAHWPRWLDKASKTKHVNPLREGKPVVKATAQDANPTPWVENVFSEDEREAPQQLKKPAQSLPNSGSTELPGISQVSSPGAKALSPETPSQHITPSSSQEQPRTPPWEPNPPLPLDSGKKRKRLKKDGLAARLQRLLSCRQASLHLSRYEMSVGFRRPGESLLVVQKAWVERGRLLVHCSPCPSLEELSQRHVGETSSTQFKIHTSPFNVEVSVQTLWILVLDMSVLPLAQLHVNSAIKIFAPWQTMFIPRFGVTLILGVSHAQLVPSEMSPAPAEPPGLVCQMKSYHCACLESPRNEPGCNFRFPDEGTELMQLLFPVLQQKSGESAAEGAPSQLCTLQVVAEQQPAQKGTVAEAVASHSRALVSGMWVSVRVLRIFCFRSMINSLEEDEASGGSAFDLMWSLLGDDSSGELCEVVIGCPSEDHITKEWIEITTGTALGQRYTISGLNVTRRATYSNSSGIWGFHRRKLLRTSDIDDTSSSHQMFFYIFSIMPEMFKIEKLTSSAGLNIVPQIETLADVMKQASKATSRHTVLVKVLIFWRENLFVTDTSLADQEPDCGVPPVVRVNVKPVNALPQNLLWGILCLRDVLLCKGELFADKYCRIFAVERDDVSKAFSLCVDSALLEPLRNLEPKIPPLKSSSAIMDIVSVTGTIVGVDEESAVMWPVCAQCGEDVVEQRGHVQLLCERCGFTEHEPRICLQVFLSCPQLPGTRVKVNLLQRTILRILPAALDETELEVQSILNKQVGPLTCIYTESPLPLVTRQNSLGPCIVLEEILLPNV